MSLNLNLPEAESEGIEYETKRGGSYPVYKEISQFTVNGTASPLINSLHRSM